MNILNNSCPTSSLIETVTYRQPPNISPGLTFVFYGLTYIYWGGGGGGGVHLEAILVSNCDFTSNIL